MLNVTGTVQQFLDLLPPLVRAGIGEEVADLLHPRNAPGEIEVNAAKELRIARGRGGRGLVRFPTGGDVFVDFRGQYGGVWRRGGQRPGEQRPGGKRDTAGTEAVHHGVVSLSTQRAGYCWNRRPT